MHFDGTNDGLLVEVNPLADSPAFTIEVLFRPDEGGPEAQRIFHLQDTKTWRVMLETRLDGKGGWWLDTFLGATGVSRSSTPSSSTPPAAGIRSRCVSTANA